jgi:lipopolysaccharide/colanic/teichoic acid biosynthesis glycosyltransferase
VKRALDVVGAGIGLIALAPVMTVVAILVAVRLGRPVLFHQPRPGRAGKVFVIHKFRTLAPRDAKADRLDDGRRMTTFGRRLRSTSLDELPTLWNVLRGEMSIVGPRPLLVEYLERYTPEQARRHEVRPGMTGLAQVSGRNLLSWPDKFDLDLRYVERRSFTLDLRILLATIVAVGSRRGITAKGHATAERFGGER